MPISNPAPDEIRKNRTLLIVNKSDMTRSRKEDLMPTRSYAVRRHTRAQVNWPVLYALHDTNDFLGNGTICDVVDSGCRVTGTMPVEVGMRLRLWGGPSEKPEPLQIAEATVLWSKGHEFGLNIQPLGVVDQRWLTGFLADRLSQWLLRQAV